MELFVVMGVLTIFPLGAAIIGALYLRLYFKLKTKSAIAAGSLWVLYSVYETLMYTRVLCTGECNIRIDLLLIYPLIIIASLVATVLYYREKSRVDKIADATEPKQ